MLCLSFCRGSPTAEIQIQLIPAVQQELPLSPCTAGLLETPRIQWILAKRHKKPDIAHDSDCSSSLQWECIKPSAFIKKTSCMDTFPGRIFRSVMLHPHYWWQQSCHNWEKFWVALDCFSWMLFCIKACDRNENIYFEKLKIWLWQTLIRSHLRQNWDYTKSS